MKRTLAASTIVALAAVAAWTATDFAAFQLTLVLSYAIAIAGLNLLTGCNGQFSLGHSAFFALGAYIAAIMIEQHGLSFYWTLPAAGIASFCAGFLFGWPVARLQGLYLALATFALAVATPQILKAPFLEAWTGGGQGIVVGKPSAPFGLPLGADRWLCLVSLAMTSFLLFLAARLAQGRFGRIIIAIRDNPVAAQTSGIDIALYKSITFGLSAAYAGIAGAIAATALGFVGPDSFTFSFAIALFVGFAVGGAGSIWGSLIGAAFILFVPNFAEGISKNLAGAVYGIILIAIVYLMPSGAAGLLRATGEKMRIMS
jgi:branched-chain amino acid transport system permease protein